MSTPNRQSKTKYDVANLLIFCWPWWGSSSLSGQSSSTRTYSPPLWCFLSLSRSQSWFKYACFSRVSIVARYLDDEVVMSERETHSKCGPGFKWVSVHKSHIQAMEFFQTQTPRKSSHYVLLLLRACDFSECLCSRFCLASLMLPFFSGNLCTIYSHIRIAHST